MRIKAMCARDFSVHGCTFYAARGRAFSFLSESKKPKGNQSKNFLHSKAPPLIGRMPPKHSALSFGLWTHIAQRVRCVFTVASKRFFIKLFKFLLLILQRCNFKREEGFYIQARKWSLQPCICILLFIFNIFICLYLNGFKYSLRHLSQISMKSKVSKIYQRS